jgi:hypothetical protein
VPFETLVVLNLFGACVNGRIGTNFLTILTDAPAGKRAGAELVSGPVRAAAAILADPLRALERAENRFATARGNSPVRHRNGRRHFLRRFEHIRHGIARHVQAE